jgi:signal transduction histidine kinase
VSGVTAAGPAPASPPGIATRFVRAAQVTIRLAVSESPSGVLLRRLAPAAVVLPAVLALLRQEGEHAGLFGLGFGRALLVAANSLVFLLLIAWTATAIARADELRRAAEHRLRTLADVSDAFAAVATADQPLLDQIARTVADIVGDGCLVTLMSDDGDQLYNAANAHRNPALEDDYKTYVSHLSLATLTSPSVAATVARTGQPARAEIAPDEMVARSEDALKPMVARLAVHGYAVVPIRARGAVIGTLSVLRSTPGRAYTDQDVTLLADLADRAGLAIENARLYAQLEQRVHARTAELEAANHELEAFSSSVAHDLRAPLRAIAGFSEALLEDAADRLAPDDVRHATQIRDAARRMGELIAALLELARISRTEPHRRRVDVSELARTILGRLRAAQPERDVEVEIGDGLIAFADPRLVEIALTNLLGNAWKFTGKRANARIELGAMPGGPPPVYFVRDNGAGFDPAHAGKLFGAFQRLHAAADFEGTGVGLATVQRIVARHGGTIWAEAEPDRGAAFYFTLQAPVTGRAASRRSPS